MWGRTFWGCFDPVWDHFRGPVCPQKASKRPVSGPQKGFKNGRQCVFFPKMTLDRSGVVKHAFWARFEAVRGRFKAPFGLQTPLKCLILGSKGAEKGQVNLATPRMPKHMFWAVLEPKKGRNRLAKRSPPCTNAHALCGSVPTQTPG